MVSKRALDEVQESVLFPIRRIRRNLKESCRGNKIQIEAAIHLATVLDYLTDELLQISREQAKLDKKHRITPRHIRLAINEDSDFSEVFKNVTIADSGVTPMFEKIQKPENNVIIES